MGAPYALGPSRLVQRACIAALSRAEIDRHTIALFTQTHPRTVHRWVCRVEETCQLSDRTRSGRPRRFTATARFTAIAVYCQHQPPLPGVRCWSLRLAQAHFTDHPELLGRPIGHATIQRILREHALEPHRRRYYLQITDPDFFPKMEQILELYLHPPQHLFCFDECTCIQALERVSPDQPADSGQPVRQEFDYRRHGITDLMAFLHPGTGKVYGQCVPNHDRHTLCRVFTAHVRTLPPDATIHYIMDNLSPHYHDDFCRTVAQLSGVPYASLETGAARRRWLGCQDKRIVIHFLPCHASWLNLVEIWFGLLKSKCLNYGHFTSLEQLVADILAFIQTWNECWAHPFSWSYTGKALHAKAVRRFCRLLALETQQMDANFLKNQLLLMSNIARDYLKLIPSDDWLQLLRLADEKHDYITHILETETKPRRQKQAKQAYHHFLQTVVNRTEPLAQVG